MIMIVVGIIQGGWMEAGSTAREKGHIRKWRTISVLMIRQSSDTDAVKSEERKGSRKLVCRVTSFHLLVPFSPLISHSWSAYSPCSPRLLSLPPALPPYVSLILPMSSSMSPSSFPFLLRDHFRQPSKSIIPSLLTFSHHLLFPHLTILPTLTHRIIESYPPLLYCMSSWCVDSADSCQTGKRSLHSPQPTEC